MGTVVRPISEATQSLIAKVEDVRPAIEDFTEQSESNRQLADEIYDALLDAGFFRALVPKAFGGLELHPVDAYRIWESIARVDSAAGWNAGVVALHPETGRPRYLPFLMRTVLPATKVSAAWLIVFHGSSSAAPELLSLADGWLMST